MSNGTFGQSILPRFDRNFLGSGVSLSRIGDGEYGGKGRGLVFAGGLLDSWDRNAFPNVEVSIPTSLVLATDVFDTFVEQNRLRDAIVDLPDDRIALAFQKADFPVEHVGDLRALVDQFRLPLAVRSSSLLEDAMFRPFAGVYETKMVPNNQADANKRFRSLIEAVKFVYASMYMEAARRYLQAADRTLDDEKMAVVIQAVVGEQHDVRYYPHMSGVARSYNFYPAGRSRPEEGVVNLALGLGKTIVDGGVSWAYSPAHPKAPPPFGSESELLKNTQLRFWAINMGAPPEYNPIAETEYLVEADLRAAEYDGTLQYLASTFSAQAGRLVPGVGTPGARAINFAPLLLWGDFAINEVVKRLLSACETALDTDVEIEFAATFPRSRDGNAHLGFLQVRPMVVSDEMVEVTDEELGGPGVLLTSERAMGNGVVGSVRDIVFVKPDCFEARHTRSIAGQLQQMNQTLRDEDRPYLLIGFGRWGSSDPWLGIPVDWGQISGAKVLVEASLPAMNVESSQGSHFFHNLTSFNVSYFSVPKDKNRDVDWKWLDSQRVVAETEHVRHVRLETSLLIKVDGRSGRGGIWHSDSRN